MKVITTFVLACFWIFGIVLANGFWSTFFAIVFPLWAYYLTAEGFLIYLGVI